MRESAIERHFVRQVKAHGGVTYKMRVGGGFPDRLLIKAYNANDVRSACFVELKRPGGKLRRLQKITIAELRKRAQLVVVLDTKKDVDRFVRAFCA